MNVKENVELSEIATMLSNHNIVLFYNGRSEAGPRALGNRSVLFNPYTPHGKDIINSSKKREWFRPLACTILEEEFSNWFYGKVSNCTYFMTSIFYALEEKKQLIPNVLHVDGSCRVQTINKKQNPNYYALIKEFYKLTGIPLILNTSFNTAGEPIVETPLDALNSFELSNFYFLYFAQTKQLIFK